MINKDNIEELIGKYLSGEASPEEAIVLEDWKNASSENMQYFADCQKLFNSRPAKVDTQSAWHKVKEQMSEDGSANTWSYLRIAASVALIALLSVTLVYMFEEGDNLISYQTTNSDELIVLADSSSITLAPNSQLSYDKDFGKRNRKVSLKGDARFTVIHEDSLPFIVDVDGLFIKDIGTIFDVKESANTDTIIVRVEEGVVLMFDNQGASITVVADEKAVYIRSEKRLQKVIEKNPNAVLKFDFNGRSLSEILDELGKAYGINITLESEELGVCELTTQFNNEDIETILSVITETLGLEFIKTPEGYQIKGSKCNG